MIEQCAGSDANSQICEAVACPNGADSGMPAVDSIDGKGGVQTVALCLRQGSPGGSSPVRLSDEWSALKRGFNQNVGCGAALGSGLSGSF